MSTLTRDLDDLVDGTRRYFWGVLVGALVLLPLIAAGLLWVSLTVSPGAMTAAVGIGGAWLLLLIVLGWAWLWRRVWPEDR